MPGNPFEESDDMTEKLQEGLPVAGYRPQSQVNLDLVNSFKADEERLLRKLDALSNEPGYNASGRWLAIGRTQLEQAFMAINRAVFKPGRVTLPEDAKDEATRAEFARDAGASEGARVYPGGRTKAEWDPVAKASFQSAAHLPED